MRILQVSSVLETVPPRKYGGVERVVYILCQELSKLGHRVYLFAPQGSTTCAKLIPNAGEQEFSGVLSPKQEQKKTQAEEKMVTKVLTMAEDFDVIHCHFGPEVDACYRLIQRYNSRTVFTLHGTLDWYNRQAGKYVWQVYRDNPLYRKANYISISNNQREPALWLNYLATVYNGVYPEEFQFMLRPKGEYLLFVGRTTPDKGIDLAIQAARTSGKKLVIFARIDPPEFFQEKIKPMIDQQQIIFYGEDSQEDIKEYFANAYALLFPIRWREPFGLVMIEAMACGTPVIAFANGSVPEVVEDGVSGFIVNESARKRERDWTIEKTGLAGLQAAIERVYALRKEDYLNMRRACRRRVEEKFSAQKMVQGYIQVYRKLVGAKTA